MELVIWCKKEDYPKVSEILKTDELVSKSSLIFREASIIGKDGYYCYISGLPEACDRAKEITKELAKVVEGEEKERVIKTIKEEENKAIEGFGAILG